MSFSSDGYVIYKSFFSEEMLEKYEEGFVNLLEMQAGKVGLESENLDDGLAEFEAEDKEALHQVCKMAMNLSSACAIASDKSLLSVCGNLLMAKNHQNLMITRPEPLVNMPGVKRLLYKWHSEAHYYPKRRNFLNVWFPILREKDSGNGTMEVLPGTHTQEWPFLEYQVGPNHFVQYEIPETELDGREVVPIEAKPGDVVFFHRNLVHRSTENMSGVPSFAAVMRVADYSRDYTLASDLEVTPYSLRPCPDISRPGLTVES